VVVLMTARDETTSFKIFSTLNGRGVDLAVIDKLKPELLQVGLAAGGLAGLWRCGAWDHLCCVCLGPRPSPVPLTHCLGSWAGTLNPTPPALHTRLALPMSTHRRCRLSSVRTLLTAGLRWSPPWAAPPSTPCLTTAPSLSRRQQGAAGPQAAPEAVQAAGRRQGRARS
jgi:hypothetical protein